jgi:hypothetical protein
MPTLLIGYRAPQKDMPEAPLAASYLAAAFLETDEHERVRYLQDAWRILDKMGVAHGDE